MSDIADKLGLKFLVFTDLEEITEESSITY
jgi:hypothetical protein